MASGDAGSLDCQIAPPAKGSSVAFKPPQKYNNPDHVPSKRMLKSFKCSSVALWFDSPVEEHKGGFFEIYDRNVIIWSEDTRHIMDYEGSLTPEQRLKVYHIGLKGDSLQERYEARIFTRCERFMQENVRAENLEKWENCRDATYNFLVSSGGKPASEEIYKTVISAFKCHVYGNEVQKNYFLPNDSAKLVSLPVGASTKRITDEERARGIVPTMGHSDRSAMEIDKLVLEMDKMSGRIKTAVGTRSKDKESAAKKQSGGGKGKTDAKGTRKQTRSGGKASGSASRGDDDEEDDEDPPRRSSNRKKPLPKDKIEEEEEEEDEHESQGETTEGDPNLSSPRHGASRYSMRESLTRTKRLAEEWQEEDLAHDTPTKRKSRKRSPPPPSRSTSPDVSTASESPAYDPEEEAARDKVPTQRTRRTRSGPGSSKRRRPDSPRPNLPPPRRVLPPGATSATVSKLRLERLRRERDQLRSASSGSSIFQPGQHLRDLAHSQIQAAAEEAVDDPPPGPSTAWPGAPINVHINVTPPRRSRTPSPPKSTAEAPDPATEDVVVVPQLPVATLRTLNQLKEASTDGEKRLMKYIDAKDNVIFRRLASLHKMVDKHINVTYKHDMEKVLKNCQMSHSWARAAAGCTNSATQYEQAARILDLPWKDEEEIYAKTMDAAVKNALTVYVIEGPEDFTQSTFTQQLLDRIFSAEISWRIRVVPNNFIWANKSAMDVKYGIPLVRIHPDFKTLIKSAINALPLDDKRLKQSHKGKVEDYFRNRYYCVLPYRRRTDLALRAKFKNDMIAHLLLAEMRWQMETITQPEPALSDAPARRNYFRTWAPIVMVRLAKMRAVYPNGPPPSIRGRQPTDGKTRGMGSKIGAEHEEAIRTANADDIDAIDLAGTQNRTSSYLNNRVHSKVQEMSRVLIHSRALFM